MERRWGNRAEQRQEQPRLREPSSQAALRVGSAWPSRGSWRGHGQPQVEGQTLLAKDLASEGCGVKA